MINKKIKQLFINCGNATAAFFIGYCIKVFIEYSYFSITGLKINLDTAQYIFGLIVGLIYANLLKECKEYKNSIEEYNNKSKKYNKYAEEYAGKQNYKNLKKNYKKLRKTYIELFNLHHSTKEKSDKIIFNYLSLESEHKKLEIKHDTLTVENYALNEMLHGNKLLKKIEEYEMFLQIFLKLDFEELLFLINSSDIYKNNIIPILINKIKYGKKDLANQEEECEENIKKNILNFHIMECNQYISRCIAGLPQKKSIEM